MIPRPDAIVRSIRSVLNASGRVIRREGAGGEVASGKLVYVSFGPGGTEPLGLLAQSLSRFEPDCRILAVDDCSGERRRRLPSNPALDFVHRLTPVGYPTGLTRLLLESYDLALRRYNFEVLLKIDTDALCLRPGAFDEARAAFADDPGLGMVGSHLPDASAEREDHRFAWLVPIIEQEASRDPVLGEALQAALANGYRPGEHVQGGVYLISRKALEGVSKLGLLRWRPRRGALVYDDMMVSLFVRAAGFRLGNLEAVRSAPNSLPLSFAEISELRPAAVHTVRRGLDGEDEDEVRGFLGRLSGV